MSTRWKEAVAYVETLDEAKREEFAKVIFDLAGDEESLRAKLAAAEADYAAGRYRVGGDDYWDERFARLKASAPALE